MSGSTAPVIPRYPAPDLSVIRPAAPAYGFDDVGSGKTYKADAVIVGSGPGGASVARKLAEGGMKVVILEEGPAQSRFLPNYANTARYHMQEGGAIVAQGSTYLPIAAGKGVGGGTLINSALCFRTPPAVLEKWTEMLGDDDWAPNRVLPVLKEVEQIIGVSMTPEDIAGENNLIVMRGAQALGYPGGLAPRNTPGCRGCGICNFGCPHQWESEYKHHVSPSGHRRWCRKFKPRLGYWKSWFLTEKPRVSGAWPSTLKPENAGAKSSSPQTE